MTKAMALSVLMISLAACAGQTEELAPVTVMLDWVPNTNHTGIFVAHQEGFFEDAGLAVEIVQPGEVFAEQAVAGNAADFGVSFQEQVTLARADDVPLVSIAAIIQNNTSGFASHATDSPAEWEGLRYGSFGSPFEEPTLRELMHCDGGDFEALEILDTGYSDPLALLDQGQIDLAWIFYGWQGVQAEQQGMDLQVVMMEDWLDCIPDYYTPVIIAAESTLQERPEIVRSFLEAVSRGYRYAIDDPAAAASILLEAAPELNEQQVRMSQDWLSTRYQGDAVRWGEQDVEVWAAYSQWMADHDILAETILADDAFTNEYLP
jgi:ABC-type nitrate/sulfonate/bicarbonate transport system substrate-binding protein